MPQNLGRLQTPKYLAFVDCGSTGSRLHAFEVQVLDQSPKSFTVVPLGNPTKVDTPLASLHHQNLEGTRQVITPLLGAAKRLVPSKYHRSTPLFVWATAGMRTLNQVFPAPCCLPVQSVAAQCADLTQPDSNQHLNQRRVKGHHIVRNFNVKRTRAPIHFLGHRVSSAVSRDPWQPPADNQKSL